MKRAYLLILIIGLAISSFAYVNTFVVNNVSDDELHTIEIIEVPENVPVAQASAVWPSKYFASRDFPQRLNKSDLVAIVEITGPVTSYSDGDNFFTLYRGRIVNCLKGKASGDELNVLQYCGYDRKHGVFIQVEGEPVLIKGQSWLFFMRKMDWEPNLELSLPENTFRPQPLTALRYEKGLLSTPTESAQILPNQLRIDGLTIEAFKASYMK
jgi:hypothetical protein